MGVSIDIYRVRIGAHNLKVKCPKFNLSRPRPRIHRFSNTKPKTCIFKVLCIIVFLNQFSILQNSSYKSQLNQNRLIFKSHEPKITAPTNCYRSTNILLQSLHDKLSRQRLMQTDPLETYPMGIKASFPSSVNHFCHVLYGNRRNVGYNYLTWNCDKGFLSQNKLDDVKVAAAKLRPHVIGISEVNLKRMENNNSEHSYSYFSTEQVQQAFYIPDYKIILPDSWTEYGMARIKLYVKDDPKG